MSEYLNSILNPNGELLEVGKEYYAGFDNFPQITKIRLNKIAVYGNNSYLKKDKSIDYRRIYAEILYLEDVFPYGKWHNLKDLSCHTKITLISPDRDYLKKIFVLKSKKKILSILNNSKKRIEKIKNNIAKV